jgi:hypothetical protein
MTWQQYSHIAVRGGMAGMGAGAHVGEFMKVYTNTMAAMANGNPANRGLGLGTDINGMQRSPRPPSLGGISNLTYTSAVPRARTGQMEWDYNVHGVAHYGLLPDLSGPRRAAARRGDGALKPLWRRRSLRAHVGNLQ